MTSEELESAMIPFLEQMTRDYLHPALRAAGVVDVERYRLAYNAGDDRAIIPDSGVPVEPCRLWTLVDGKPVCPDCGALALRQSYIDTATEGYCEWCGMDFAIPVD